MEIKASRLIKGDNNKKATNIPKRYKSSLQAKKTMFTEEIQELIKCYKTVNRHFNKSLSEALKEYSGPQITISSGVRP